MLEFDDLLTQPIFSCHTKKGVYVIKAILLFVSATMITGCVTIAQNSSQLVETTRTTQAYCYSLPQKEVGKRIVDLLSKCFDSTEITIPIGTAYVPMNQNFQVINEVLSDGNRYSLRNLFGVQYSADVINGMGKCETDVKMYGVTGFWKKTFVAVDKAINDEETKCP